MASPPGVTASSQLSQPAMLWESLRQTTFSFWESVRLLLPVAEPWLRSPRLCFNSLSEPESPKPEVCSSVSISKLSGVINRNLIQTDLNPRRIWGLQNRESRSNRLPSGFHLVAQRSARPQVFHVPAPAVAVPASLGGLLASSLPGREREREKSLPQEYPGRPQGSL